MESQEYPERHFEAMAKLASDLRALPAQILEHTYSYRAFGSWWTILQRKGITFRIVFDGKDGRLMLERASTATADSWEPLDSWPARVDTAAHAMREAVARLSTV